MSEGQSTGSLIGVCALAAVIMVFTVYQLWSGKAEFRNFRTWEPGWIFRNKNPLGYWLVMIPWLVLTAFFGSFVWLILSGKLKS